MSNKSYSERKADWTKFHRENPKVYEMFERFCEEARRRGRKHLSPWLIINRIRWESFIETANDDGYKISNNYIGFYSRLYMSRDPKNRARFFTIKPMEGEDFTATKIACGMMPVIVPSRESDGPEPELPL
jgi:hypothetical protein